MTSHTSTAAPAAFRARRRRRALTSDSDVLDALDGAEQSARQLAADLAALVHAGLLSPVEHNGELRFAVTALDEREA